MEFVLKTDVLMRFLDYLWNNNIYLFFIFTFSIFFYGIYKKGISIGKIVILKPHHNISDPNDNDFFKKYINFTKHESLREDTIDLGYIIPPNFLYLYGKLWSTSKHSDLYLKLERDWNEQDIIDIRDTNVTSILISIIEDKLMKLKSMTIIHTQDQNTTLSYLKKYENITFKEV